MARNLHWFIPGVVTSFAFAAPVRGDDAPPRPMAACALAMDAPFEDEVWAKVGAKSA